ncbi:MAG: hypothetical protein KAJ35_06545 [Thermoplasmata archaeon]|nr:hypothetical protein [Thermoplasmata archaeon]
MRPFTSTIKVSSSSCLSSGTIGYVALVLALVEVLIGLAAFMMWGKEKDNLWVEAEVRGLPDLLERICRSGGSSGGVREPNS